MSTILRDVASGLAVAVGVLAGGCLVGGCASTPVPVTQVGLNRNTPGATYEYFKAMVRANQHAAEWSVFSPNAKAQANQMVGRNVDLGDYSTARNTLASNSSADMQALINSTMAGPAQFQGPDRAIVTITGGGRTVQVRMARLASWELKVRGEAEPYGDFVRSAGDAVTVNPDGSIAVRVPGSGAMRNVAKSDIDSFAVKSQWYVDDLSSLQGAMAGAGSAPPQQGRGGRGGGRAPGPAQAPAPTGPAPSGAPEGATGAPE
jgi:hypothetical protein